MTRQGIAGDGEGGSQIVSPLVDLDGLSLDALRSSSDPDIIGMVRFFVEKCEQSIAYGGHKVDRQD
ncbi:hypothetical protein [Frankia sp. QA3]|uniref:hypothetical protein n=1 Tax=Frankia sp. QA3 TaxID=710111 RepID=UPI000269B96A|nr:hypothetical protein [Frankia sp. QA3]EIV90729.1 hypothetical protein FraQA3DRAFT_0127 [Frankia sp. QA3]